MDQPLNQIDEKEKIEMIWRSVMIVLNPFSLTPRAYENIKKLFIEVSKVNQRGRLLKNISTLQRRIESPENQLNIPDHGKVIKASYLKSFIDEIVNKNQYD